MDMEGYEMWYTALEDRKHGGKEDQEDGDH